MSDYSISATIGADDSGFQKVIENTIQGLEDFGDAFSTMTNETKQSFANLGNQFIAIDEKAKVWGDDIDVVSDKKKALRTEINKLIDSGITPESKQITDLKKAYDNLGDEAEDAGKKQNSAFSDLRDIMQGPIAAMQLVISAISGIASKIGELDAAWEVQRQAEIKVETVLESTGATAWTTAEHLKTLASSLQETTNYGDESILTMQSVLLGFRNIQGTNFDEATKSVLSMATVMGMDLKSAAQSVGKALDDPISGMDSLTKQGFKFSDAEKEMMKTMVEAGDIAGAQKYIIDELNKTFGDAAGNTYSLSTAIKNVAGDINEQLGRTLSIVLEPLKEKILEISSSIVEIITKFNDWLSSGDNLANTLKSTATVITTVGAAIGAYALIASGATIATIAHTVATTAQTVATKAATIAHSALNAVMKANPVGIVTAAVILLVGAAVLLADKLGGWKVLFLEVQKIALTVVSAIMDYFSWLTNNVITAINTVLKVYNSVVSIVGGKQITLFDPVDISTATGIKEKIVDINDQILAEKKAKANLAIQDDKTSKTQTKNAAAVSDAIESSYDSATEDTKKYFDALNNSLENAKDREVSAAKERGASASEVSEIIKNYDDKILENYKNSMALQLEEEVKAATSKKASAEDIATIKNSYELQITNFEKDQLADREKEMEKYNDEIEKKAKEKYKFEQEWEEKITTNNESNLNDRKTKAVEYAEKNKVSANTYKDILISYDNKILENYKTNIEAQRAASLKEASEKSADAETVTNINKYYNQQITDFEKEQSEVRLTETNEYTEKIKQALLTNIDAIKSYASSVFDSIGGDGADVLNSVLDTGMSITTAAASGFMDISANIAALSAIISLAGESNAETYEEIQGQLEEVAGILMDVLAPILYVVLDVVSAILTVMSGNLDDLDLFGSIVIIIGSAFTAYAIATNLATIATTAQSVAIGVATAAQTAFNIAMTANPIGIVVAAVAALVAAIALLILNWDDVTEAASGFFNKMADVGEYVIQGLISGILSIGSTIWSSVSSVFTKLGSNIVGVFDGTKTGIVNVFSGIATILKAPFNVVLKVINTAIDALNNISVKIPSWVPGIGGKSFGISISNIAYLASGADDFEGLAIAGEAGRELVTNNSGYAAMVNSATLLNLPKGSNVINNKNTEALLAGAGGSSTNVTLAPVFNSPKAMSQSEQMRALKQYQKSLAFKGVLA